MHFHCCIIDGVFEPAGAADAAAGVVFHEASGLAAAAVATVQTQVRHRVLRAFVRRSLLEQCDSDEMGGWAHGGGFSLDAIVRIEGADRAGRERLLRYCDPIQNNFAARYDGAYKAALDHSSTAS